MRSSPSTVQVSTVIPAGLGEEVPKAEREYDSISRMPIGSIRFISDGQRFYDEETELAIVEWVLQNNHNAGATTKNFPDAQYLYFAVRVNERIYGVVGIDAMAGALDASEQSILLSILGETALALENEKNISRYCG